MRAWGIEKGRIVDARRVVQVHLVDIGYATRWRSATEGAVLKVMIWVV
jgi:hypothetical protein